MVQAQKSNPYLAEAGKLISIAGPLILASLVSMGISITDVVMMGWLSTEALAAGAAVSDYYSIFFYLTAGVIAAISPMISQARGARQHYKIRSITQQGFILAITITIPGAIMVWNAEMMLRWLGIGETIVVTGQPYAHMMAITYFAMMAVNVLHHFLSAHGKTRMILLVTVTALPLNALGNYALIFGNFGLPALGLMGAGVASLITASYMFAMLLLYSTNHNNFRRYRLLARPFTHREYHVPEIIRVGLPIGLSNLGEMGVFLFSTVTMGVFGAEVLAAHTVALRMAGVLYAFPLGMAQAATVRVGYAVGARDEQSVLTIMKTALLLSVSAAVIFFTTVLLWNAQIVHWFLGDNALPVIAAQALTFLTLLAVIQPFDGVACVGAGILRGFKDTQVPMLFSMTAFWGVGFIGGWSLAFLLGFEGLGIWIGLTSAAITYSMLVGLRLYNNVYRKPQWQLMAGM
ncbi:MATE family efflux transporter [Kaarinaea lacus]